MGKSLKGKELGVGISQQTNGLYVARFTDRFGRRESKRFKKLQECRQWIADATYIDEHSDLENATDMLVDAWFEYWIDLKKKTVRPNTVRNYSERYERNIKNVIGNKLLTEVKPINCQKIFSDMADEGYKTTTIYQTRIALYNMLEFAKEKEVIITNPCKKSVKSDIGKPSDKKEALTIERSMEFRYKVGEWRVGPPKSKSGYRTIPLTDEAICILKAQKEKNRKLKVIDKEWADTVFLCRKGQPVKNSTYDTALFKICDKAGIKRFSMHVLRHTFATRCIEGGMMPKTLQKILGHSNIGITMNLYVHITEEEKQKEIDLVAEALKAGVAI